MDYIKLLVIDDSGHGGKDSGGVGNGLKEKELNLADSDMIVPMLLEYKNVVVERTRTTDEYMTPSERIRRVNAIIEKYRGKVDQILVLSHHHNMYNGVARGGEVIDSYYNENDNKLALRILDEWKSCGLPIRRRFSKLGSGKSDYYYMIRKFILDAGNDGYYEIEAIILESGFVDNVEDAKLLKDAQFNIDKNRGTVNAIAWYYGLEKKATGGIVTTSPTLVGGAEIPVKSVMVSTDKINALIDKITDILERAKGFREE